MIQPYTDKINPFTKKYYTEDELTKILNDFKERIFVRGKIEEEFEKYMRALEIYKEIIDSSKTGDEIGISSELIYHLISPVNGKEPEKEDEIKKYFKDKKIKQLDYGRSKKRDVVIKRDVVRRIGEGVVLFIDDGYVLKKDIDDDGGDKE